jgi:hypothetical protein
VRGRRHHRWQSRCSRFLRPEEWRSDSLLLRCFHSRSALSCSSGLPQFSACQFTPPSLTFIGNNVAQISQLVVFTLNDSAVPGRSASGFLWLPAGVLACFIALRRRRLGPMLRPLLMLAFAALVLLSLTGCGGGTFITPAGSNTVTITATGSSGTSTMRRLP